MVDPGEMAETVATISASLDSAGVIWAIGGSLASTAYGEPRATNDVDVIAGMSPDENNTDVNTYFDRWMEASVTNGVDNAAPP
jgi:hypothetical protein